MSTCLAPSSSLAVPRQRQRGLRTRTRRDAGVVAVVAPVRAFASAGPSSSRPSSSDANETSSSSTSSVSLGRRTAATALVLGLAAGGATTPAARADESSGLKIISEKEGFGSKVAKTGDLVLVNYYATLADGDQKGKFFDTTLGGEKFFTNGNNQSVLPAEARPVIIKVNGSDPVPGICKGLKRGLEGMRVGGL